MVFDCGSITLFLILLLCTIIWNNLKLLWLSFSHFCSALYNLNFYSLSSCVSFYIGGCASGRSFLVVWVLFYFSFCSMTSIHGYFGTESPPRSSASLLEYGAFNNLNKEPRTNFLAIWSGSHGWSAQRESLSQAGCVQVSRYLGIMCDG